MQSLIPELVPPFCQTWNSRFDRTWGLQNRSSSQLSKSSAKSAGLEMFIDRFNRHFQDFREKGKNMVFKGFRGFENYCFKMGLSLWKYSLREIRNSINKYKKSINKYEYGYLYCFFHLFWGPAPKMVPGARARYLCHVGSWAPKK